MARAWYWDKKKIDAHQKRGDEYREKLAELRTEKANMASVQEAIRVELVKVQEERATHKTLAPMDLDAIPEWGRKRREIEQLIEDLQAASSQFRVREKALEPEIEGFSRNAIDENKWLAAAEDRRRVDRELGVGQRLPRIVSP